MRAVSQLRAGPSTGGNRAQWRQPVPVMSSFRGSRFGDGARRGPIRFDPYLFRGSYGPRMGFGFEPGFFGMGSKVSSSDIRKLMQVILEPYCDILYHSLSLYCTCLHHFQVTR